MIGPLFEYYYLIRISSLALILVCGAILAIFWLLRRRWQRRQKTLEQALAECQADQFQKLHGYFHRIIAHEYGKGLDYILNKSSETLEYLEREQIALRDKQNGIITKTHELKQHAMNILYVFAMQPDRLKKELLDIRQLIESVLLELFPYAESQGVTLQPDLEDMEPVILDRDLTMLAIRNLVHNAIKYSERGHVAQINLTQIENPPPGKTIIITVKDHGRGVQPADQQALFTLNMRGDGLIETGSGLGLYCARKAASLQGGDVILESSSTNQGSIFKISLPFTKPGESIRLAKKETPHYKQAALHWGLAIAGLLGLAGLSFIIFKPPQQVIIRTQHNNFGDRYVTALGVDGDWRLTQDYEVSDCGKFTMIHRGDKTALLTCHDRFITAPWMPNEGLVKPEHDKQWLIWQDSNLGECGLFDLVELSNGKVALRTCTGMVITAADGNWPGELAWSLVAETGEIKEWEAFTLEPQP